MKIGILGTRGIPNNYGGFEQFAQYLSVGLLQRGHLRYLFIIRRCILIKKQPGMEWISFTAAIGKIR